MQKNATVIDEEKSARDRTSLRAVTYDRILLQAAFGQRYVVNGVQEKITLDITRHMFRFSHFRYDNQAGIKDDIANI